VESLQEFSISACGQDGGAIALEQGYLLRDLEALWLEELQDGRHQVCLERGLPLAAIRLLDQKSGQIVQRWSR
jgi:hypothetical protein